MEDFGERKVTCECWGLGRNGLLVGMMGHMVKCLLNFLRNFQIVLQSGSTIFIFPSKYTSSSCATSLTFAVVFCTW